jgi:hypothetical protein
LSFSYEKTASAIEETASAMNFEAGQGISTQAFIVPRISKPIRDCTA